MKSNRKVHGLISGSLLSALIFTSLSIMASAQAKPSCTSPRHTIDEAKNKLGPNRCKNHCNCDGARTCSPHGWCQGKDGR